MESFSEYNVCGNIKRFKNVSSKDSYLLGYLACDGGFVVNKGFSFMMVSSTERYIIDELKALYLPDSTIHSLGVRSSEKVNAINNVYELRWPGKASKQFSKYGIFCKKKDRRLVGIPKHEMYSYMAGVIDADGFISVSHRKDCRSPRLRFFVTHASELYLADLQNWLPVSTTLRQHKGSCWRLQGQNTEENKVFLSGVLPFLRNRKKIKVLSDYLNKYYVPQASGELLESFGQSAAKPQEVEGSETR